LVYLIVLPTHIHANASQIVNKCLRLIFRFRCMATSKQLNPHR